MKNKLILYISVFILSLLFIIIDRFFVVKMYGWLEFILLIFSIVTLLFNILKLYHLINMPMQLKSILLIVFILFTSSFFIISIDYKRYKNLYDPLFNVGYEVKLDYNMSIYTGDVYMCRSTFYLLNIKIGEININNR